MLSTNRVPFCPVKIILHYLDEENPLQSGGDKKIEEKVEEIDKTWEISLFDHNGAIIEDPLHGYLDGDEDNILEVHLISFLKPTKTSFCQNF